MGIVEEEALFAVAVLGLDNPVLCISVDVVVVSVDPVIVVEVAEFGKIELCISATDSELDLFVSLAEVKFPT